MQKELLKVALIGVGSVGKKYARMITAGEVPHMKLSAVVIRRDELIEWGESLVNTDVIMQGYSGVQKNYLRQENHVMMQLL